MVRGRELASAALLALSMLGACAGDDSSPAETGTLVVGYYTRDDYHELSDGAECPILWGLQGGNWTMPTLRAQNLGPEITARGSLTLDGEVLGEADLEGELLDRGDGWLELVFLPIPVAHAAPNQAAPIDDIYHRMATLWIAVEDPARRSAEVSWRLLLTPSEIPE